MERPLSIFPVFHITKVALHIKFLFLNNPIGRILVFSKRKVLNLQRCNRRMGQPALYLLCSFTSQSFNPLCLCFHNFKRNTEHLIQLQSFPLPLHLLSRRNSAHLRKSFGTCDIWLQIICSYWYVYIYFRMKNLPTIIRG